MPKKRLILKDIYEFLDGHIFITSKKAIRKLDCSIRKLNNQYINQNTYISIEFNH